MSKTLNILHTFSSLSTISFVHRLLDSIVPCIQKFYLHIVVLRILDAMIFLGHGLT